METSEAGKNAFPKMSAKLFPCHSFILWAISGVAGGLASEKGNYVNMSIYSKTLVESLILLEILKKRRSVRKFLDKKIEEEKLLEVLKAAMFAPTAKNLRPWEFIVVTGEEDKKQFSLATRYSSFAKNAPVVVVICYDMKKGNRFKEDCAICAQNIYLEAVNQGLGTCYIQIAEGTEGSVGEPEAFVKKLLNIPDTYRVLCLMPIGYPAEHPKPHNEDTMFDITKIHTERF